MPADFTRDSRFRYAALAAATATATAGPGDTVTVSGTGSVEGVPDTLDATLDVHARDASVQTALNDSAADVRRVLAALSLDPPMIFGV